MIVRHSPHTSAFARELAGPEMAAWNTGAVTAWLLAMVTDLLQVANWQRASDPKHQAPQPKFVPRPGERAAVQGTPMDLDALDARLGWTGHGPRDN